MSEQLSRMLERAVEQAPVSALTSDGLVAAGRARVRRRRAVGVGAGLGTLAIAGTLWLGLSDGQVLGTPDVIPASVAWEAAESEQVTLVEREAPDGVSSVVVTGTAEGTEATVVVEGQEETVPGTTTGFGAQLFTTDQLTVLVWDQPTGVDGVQMVPAHDGFGEWGPARDDDDLWYALLQQPVDEPRDLLFHDGAAVWTASGAVAEVVPIGDGRVEREVFVIPELELAGVVDEGIQLIAQGDALIGSESLPWWRGGGDLEWVLARLPQEAAQARLVSQAPGQHVDGDPVADTVEIGGSAWALLSRGPVGVGQGSRYAPDVQWSADGQQWQDREGASVDLLGLDGLDFARDGDSVRASRSGAVLEELPGMGEGVWAWEDAGGVVVLAEVTDLHPTAELAPVVAYPGLVTGTGASALSSAAYLVSEGGMVDVAGEELPAVRVTPSDEREEVVGVLLVNSLVSDESVRVLGGRDASPELPISEGVTVSAASGVELWATFTDADRPAVLDGPGLVAVAGEGETWSLVARLPAGGAHPAVVPADEGMTVQQPLGEVTEVGGIRWWSLTLQAPGMDDLRAQLEGLDTDGDGEVDLPLDLLLPEG